MSFLSTPNRGPERLVAFASVGWLFAIMLGHNGHLSMIPMTLGAGLGFLGLTLKFVRREMTEEER
jgi:hypothetical protein